MRKNILYVKIIALLFIMNVSADDSLCLEQKKSMEYSDAKIEKIESEILNKGSSIKKGELLYNCESALLFDNCDSKRIYEAEARVLKDEMLKLYGTIESLRENRSLEYKNCFDEIIKLSPPPKSGLEKATDVFQTIFE